MMESKCPQSNNVDVLTPGIHLLTKKVYKYQWDEDWIKTVKAGYCPDCKKPFIHRAIIWTCPHCGLYLKGAAGALSYTLKELTKEDPKVERKDKCPECGSTVFEHDFKHDETICRGCGLVLDGPPGFIPENIKLNYPFGYNFDSELVFSFRKSGTRVIGFYYTPRYYKDPHQLTSYIK